MTPNTLAHQQDDTLAAPSQAWTQWAKLVPGTLFQFLETPDGRATFPFIRSDRLQDYGLTPALLREDAAGLLFCLHPEDLDAFLSSLQDAKQTGRPWEHLFRMVLPDNRTRWLRGKAQPEIREDGTVLWHGYLDDLTEHIHAEEKIWQSHYFDRLTALPNRHHFLELLERETHSGKVGQAPFALCFVGLDHFREINESHGHRAGDALLGEVAQRLQSCMAADDVLSYLGGDTFGVLLRSGDAVQPLQSRASEMLAALAHPFCSTENAIHLSASIGMALFPNDTTHSEDLLRFSERAMYAAKQEGRNRYRFFKPIMQAHVQKRSLLLQELRKALVDYPFVLHYQPIIELATGKVTKLEALIRWPHPTLGLINPSEFIPLAEEAGMIGEISDWVFHQATQDIARWRANIDPALQVGINLSPALFQKGNRRIQSWLQHLTEMNLPGQAVMGEITEGMLLNSTDSVVRRFAALRAADIKIALDDFGTGYASLSYLKKFDIGLIKIDKSFVQNLSPQSSDMALCEAIIVMAHKLGLAVVAEGIETAAQHALLAAAGCNFGQGYLFAKPMAAGAVDTWLSQSRLRPPIAATA